MRALTLMLLAACAPMEPTDAAAPETLATAEVPNDSGGACMTGCAVEPAGPLSDDEIASLLAKVAIEPYGAPTIALETVYRVPSPRCFRFSLLMAGDISMQESELSISSPNMLSSALSAFSVPSNRNLSKELTCLSLKFNWLAIIFLVPRFFLAK